MIATKLLKNTRYRAGHIMGRHGLLFRLIPFAKQNKWKKVSPTKDICIEGFPRSANSFFAVALRMYNPTIKSAHHMHAPMQVIKAADYGIPCIVLIRNPIDAIASVLVVDRTLSTRFAIQSYISFYESVWPVRQHFVVSDFTDTTTCPHRTIERVNQRFGTSFKMEPVTPEMKARIFTRLREAQQELKQPENLVAIPTEAKARIKQDVLQALSEHPLLPTATSLYEKFVADTVGVDTVGVDTVGADTVGALNV